MPAAATPNERSSERYHPWSTFADARDEARIRGDRAISTEHLLIALLREPELAKALGADASSARTGLNRLDSEALATIGLRSIPPIYSQPDEPAVLQRARTGRPSVRELLTRRSIGMTPAAKAVLRESGRETLRQQLGAWHVLQALLDLGPADPATQLLDALGVDRAAARRRLARLDEGSESAAA